METRNCPICDSEEEKEIMFFNTDMLIAKNLTYNSEVFRSKLRNFEKYLTYSSCTNCGMVFNKYIWTNEILKYVYIDSIDHDKSLKKTVNIAKRLELVREWNSILRVLLLNGVSKLENLKILDYGCGWGDFMEVVKGYDINIIGFDEDEIKSGFAKNRGLTILNEFDQIKEHKYFDIIVMNSVLEHIINIEQLFEIINSSLRPGGLLVFLVMDYRKKYIKKNIKITSKKHPALTKDLNPIEHVNIFDYKSVIAILNKYNYRFFSTGISLTLTNLPYIRESSKILYLVNLIEKFSTKFLKGGEFAITSYAFKEK